MTTVPDISESARAAVTKQMDLGSYCSMCGAPLERARTGRPRRTCSDRCRQRLTRARVTKPDHGLLKPSAFVTRRARILETIRVRPGLTTEQLSQATGLLPNYLYRVLAHELAGGTVTKRGRAWFRTE